MAKIQDAARLSGVLPYLESEIAGMEKALETRVFSDLDARTLTPEAALAAWQEKRGYQSLLRRLKSKIRAGQSVGHGLAPRLALD